MTMVVGLLIQIIRYEKVDTKTWVPHNTYAPVAPHADQIFLIFTARNEVAAR